VTGYRIQQNGVVVGSVGGTTTSYTASGLNPSTTYSYAVAAFDAAGDISAYSAPVSQATDASSGGGTTNLALNRPTTESSHTQTYASGNAVDGNTGTYWESTNSSFPQWIQVDLGAATALGRLVLKLPPGWGARTQTLSILGSTDGSSFSTVVGSAGYTFDPGSSNVVTITLPAATARYVRLNVTANTGWPAGQLSEFEVYGTSGGGDVTPPSAPGNLTVTGHTSTSASLSWTAATDNVGVTGYQVRRTGTVVATVSGTTFTNTGLNPSTAYSYSVVATDAAGNLSVASNTVTVTTDAAPNTNLAAGKATAESSHTQTYASGNAVDGDANSYWESNNNAFPQWLQVDLGAATSVRRVVLKLPPSAAWGARTQTLSVQGSSDGASFSTIVGSAGYVFDPNTGNSVTIVFGAATARYVRLTITGNTGWPAGQISEFEIYAS
jgi:chitodextrinase